MLLDRATKATVIASAIAAIVFETIMAPADIVHRSALAVAAAFIVVSLVTRQRERTGGIVLALGCLVPVPFIALSGPFLHSWYFVPWKWALVGACAPDVRARWQFPRPMRFALVAWALAVACTWPLVALREIDWTPSLLWTQPFTSSSAWNQVPTTVGIVEAAELHLLALLLVDWMLGRWADAATQFERLIVRAMLATAVVTGVLAIYQGWIDLSFLSPSPWPGIGRAGGSLADANASGSLAALWVAIPVAISTGMRSRRTRAALWLASAVLFLAVWATGSRTSLLVALVALAVVPHLVITRSRVRARAALAAAASMIVVVAALTRLPSSAIGPLHRVQELVPNLSGSTLRSAASELWARNGYGLVAAALIRKAPLEGVGVGAFFPMSREYALRVAGRALPPDNAQNWYRHQFAELGVLGSVGWIWWIAIAVMLSMRRHVDEASRSRVLALRYTMAGFALASLLGMPAQSLIVTLTFWTLMLWLLLLTAPIGLDRTRSPRGPAVGAAVLAVGLGIVTARTGWNDLRPPFRARELGNPYSYGFYQPFDGLSGQTTTERHAVVVTHARKPYLRLTAWVEHPDANEHPVTVEIWRNHEQVLKGRFPLNQPFTRDIGLTPDGGSFLLETRTDRTFRKERADVGLQLKWEFVDAVP